MNKSSPPTIKDVALKAGVSTATVSRVISGREKVSPALIDQVNQAIEELQYRPSRVARNLRVRKANTVGLLVSDIQNPFFTSIMRGIQDTLLAKGYVLLAANSDEDEDQERIHIETLLAEEVAGIILAPASTSARNYADLIEQGVGLVIIDRIPDRLKVDSVLVDNTAGARSAVEHLISLGHRRIGIIAGREHISTATLRLEGYRFALQDAGLPFDPELVSIGDFRQEGGYQAMNALLNLAEPPTAVFSSNNVMTLGALQAIHEKCLKIPDEIALVSFDDMPWAASLQPPLSAVAQPTYEIGTTAARLLLERVNEPERSTRRVILESELIVRGSTVGPNC
ncbi:MAG: LacI family DNA-binding transcriptional regulator [Ardenticatenaceae bacterium]|nr:LacI family DNA-binding transcriptional regulator [Ardenticatenaceae bacterium]